MKLNVSSLCSSEERCRHLLILLLVSLDLPKWVLFLSGEQGALNMMPMFLIDHGVPTADVGLWTGVVGQAVSIAGSMMGGAALSSDRFE